MRRRLEGRRRVATAWTPGSDGQGFRAAADPTEPTNLRFFATNANTMIFESTLPTLFAAMPEIGEPAVRAYARSLIPL